jgi:hypothetical protein
VRCGAVWRGAARCGAVQCGARGASTGPAWHGLAWLPMAKAGWHRVQLGLVRVSPNESELSGVTTHHFLPHAVPPSFLLNAYGSRASTAASALLSFHAKHTSPSLHSTTSPLFPHRPLSSVCLPHLSLSLSLLFLSLSLALPLFCFCCFNLPGPHYKLGRAGRNERKTRKSSEEKGCRSQH